MEYIPVIGLEIHTELRTDSKMFCGCKNDPLEKKPNINICPVCTGQPGTLPVINEEAVRLVVKTGLALNCQILRNTRFERKNYFYPDLPKGYQITQYATPFCKKGFLEIPVNGIIKKININRVHLEEDTARLIHQKGYVLLDFNRAGIPLMELVTEPDISSGEEAKKFSQDLQTILRYLNVSDADMEKGQMRIEANISLGKEGELGTKVEIKNLNSFKIVEKAINYEIDRQGEILDKGEKVVQETRGWNEEKQATVSQRFKEEAHDYRYFPEPDLPPVELDDKYISRIKKEIGEMPGKKRDRFKSEFGISDDSLEILIQNKELGEYFEKVVSELLIWAKDKNIRETDKLIQIAVNYLLTDSIGLLKGKEFDENIFPITPENFAEFVSIIFKGEISSKIAKIILEEMFETRGDPSDIIERKGLAQISDERELNDVAGKIISSNPQAVEDFKKGKDNALQFLIGQMMKETKGKANPEIAKEILTKIIQKS